MWTLIKTTKRSFGGSRFLLLCIVLVVTGNVGSAWAVCGDYLLDARVTMMDHVPTDWFTNPIPHEPERVPDCSGANCHRHDRVPVTPTRLLPFFDQHDAVLIAIVRIEDSGEAFFPAEFDVKTTTGPSNRIFRPPRGDAFFQSRD